MPITYNEHTDCFEEISGSSNASEPYFLPHEEGFHHLAIKEWAKRHLQGAQVVECRNLSGISNGDRFSTAGLIQAGWFIYSAIRIVLVTSPPRHEVDKTIC